MNLTLKIWRQKSADDPGRFETYTLSDVLEEMSFLEMLDVLNEKLLLEGKDPVKFDHDCREGICGMCSLVINGRPHGPERGATVCQLYMRKFDDGDTITIEPWRAKAFPVLRDLVVDRGALDRIIQAGGYVSVKTGGTPDANAIADPQGRRGAGDGRRRRASAAAPASRPARTRRPCCSWRRRSVSSRTCRRASRSAWTRARDGGDDGRRGLRRVLEHLRLRGRLPEADLRLVHPGAAPRLPQGPARRTLSRVEPRGAPAVGGLPHAPRFRCDRLPTNGRHESLRPTRHRILLGARADRAILETCSTVRPRRSSTDRRAGECVPACTRRRGASIATPREHGASHVAAYAVR